MARGRPRKDGRGPKSKTSCLTPRATRRRRKQRLGEDDADEDYVDPSETRKRPAPPDGGSSDSEHSSAEDGLSAVGEDDRSSDSGQDDEPEGHDIGQVDYPWNSPEGWERVREQAALYFAHIKDQGHVCSICGERRHEGQDVHAFTIKGWRVGISVAYDLTKVLYPQFPLEKEVVENSGNEPWTDLQKEFYWVCRRCMDEGQRRVNKIESSRKSGKDIELGFMKYSFENTQLKFRWDGDDPLTNVTPVEESLISLISPVVTVQQITDGHKSFGNTSFFINWNSVRDVAQKLPRTIPEARVLVRYPVKNTGGKAMLEGPTAFRSHEFRVDCGKLRCCLGYLTTPGVNELYGHVGIDEDTLRALESAYKDVRGRSLEEALDEFDDLDARYCTTLDTNPIQTREIADVLREDYSRGQRVVVERSGEPVRPHLTHHLLAQAFPSLFPNGGGDYRHFPTPLSTAEMLSHTVKFGDPRFSQHPRYVFGMVNVKNLDLAYRSIGPAVKGRILKSKVDGSVEDVTEELLQKFAKVDFADSKEMESLIAQNNLIFSGLRGTPAFWDSQKTRINHTVADRGAPTAFATFSSADTRWSDMEDVFNSYLPEDERPRKDDPWHLRCTAVGTEACEGEAEVEEREEEELGEEEEGEECEEEEEQEEEEEYMLEREREAQDAQSPETLALIDVTRRQREEAEMVQRRRTLLRKNQVIAALHFVRRFKMFIKFIVKHQPLLCGKLTDWIIRYETQGRGSLHAHVLWWIDLNPGYIHPLDHVDIPSEVLERFHLYEVDKTEKKDAGNDGLTEGVCGDEAEGKDEEEEEMADDEMENEEDVCESDGDENVRNMESGEDGGRGVGRRSKKKAEKRKVYDEGKLDFVNANIWAIKNPDNLTLKLRIGMSDIAAMSESARQAHAEEDYMLLKCHPSMIDPSMVSDECLPARLSRLAEFLQEHTCTDACLVRKYSAEQVRRMSAEDLPGSAGVPFRALVKCKKNFPKVVPDGFGELQGHVVLDYNKIVQYYPPRDHPFVNNYHPVYAHLWGANTDLQILHGKGSSFPVVAYITSYISKLDKFSKVGWRDVMHELKLQMNAAAELHKGAEDAEAKIMRTYFEDIYRTIRKFTGEREITLQEAALDATGEALIEYSCTHQYVQARRPRDTIHRLRKTQHRPKRRCPEDPLVFEDMVYESHVRKYITRPVGALVFGEETVDMDKVCMYEFFAKFQYKPDPETKRQVLKLRRRRAVIIPSPKFAASMNSDSWCYQMLMLFTPFRNHDEVMYHPTDRDLSTVVTTDYVDDRLSDPSVVPPEPEVDEQNAPVAADARDMEEEDADVEVVEVREFSGPICAMRSTNVSLTTVQSTTLSTGMVSASQAGPGPPPRAVEEEEAFAETQPSEDPVFSHNADGAPMVTTQRTDGGTAPAGPAVRYPKPFKSARELLSIVIAQGKISSEFTRTKDALVVLQGAVAGALVDRATMPTEAEVMEHLRGLLGDQENTICLDELMTRVALEFNLRQRRHVVRADDIPNFFFYGPHYDAILTTFRKTASEQNRVVHVSAEVRYLNEQLPSTLAEQLDCLKDHKDRVKNAGDGYESLKFRQRLVLLMVLDTIEDLILSAASCNQSVNIRTCRLILQGEAGTGKTYVLKKVVDLLCFFLGAPAVRVFAPTAHAANTYRQCPCGSTTFHKMWQKTWGGYDDQQGNLQISSSLIGNKKAEFTVATKGIKALICDEISMISPSDVELMSRRMCDSFSENNEPSEDYFHGMPIVIMCGDLYQLPPVKAYPLYQGEFDIAEEREAARRAAVNKKARERKRAGEQPDVATKISEAELNDRLYNKVYHNTGVRIYRTFFDKCIILNENMRQKNDEAWRYLLKRVRNGTATEDDADFLNEHLFEPSMYDPIRCPEAEKWKRCKRFFPTVQAVLKQGTKMFDEAFPNLDVSFDASPVIQVGNHMAQYEDVAHFGGEVAKLAHPLRLAVGAPVMLTSNINGARDWGIVNGSTGKVAGYITLDGVLPTYVLFQADQALAGMPALRITPPGARAPIVLENTWPIPMLSKKLLRTVNRGTKEKVSISIQHFPLQLAYALTIHKAQGMTEEYACIDIVQERRGGCGGQLPYVALSRVRTADGLMLLRKVDLVSDLNRFAVSADRDKLLAEFDRMEKLQRLCITAMGYVEEDRRLSAVIEAEETRAMRRRITGMYNRV